MKLSEAQEIAAHPEKHMLSEWGEALMMLGEAYKLGDDTIKDLRIMAVKIHKEFAEYKKCTEAVSYAEHAKIWREAQKLSKFAGDANTFGEKAAELERIAVRAIYDPPA